MTQATEASIQDPSRGSKGGVHRVPGVWHCPSNFTASRSGTMDSPLAQQVLGPCFTLDMTPIGMWWAGGPRIVDPNIPVSIASAKCFPLPAYRQSVSSNYPDFVSERR